MLVVSDSCQVPRGRRLIHRLNAAIARSFDNCDSRAASSQGSRSSRLRPDRTLTVIPLGSSPMGAKRNGSNSGFAVWIDRYGVMPDDFIHLPFDMVTNATNSTATRCSGRIEQMTIYRDAAVHAARPRPSYAVGVAQAIALSSMVVLVRSPSIESAHPAAGRREWPEQRAHRTTAHLRAASLMFAPQPTCSAIADSWLPSAVQCLFY